MCICHDLKDLRHTLLSFRRRHHRRWAWRRQPASQQSVASGPREPTRFCLACLLRKHFKEFKFCPFIRATPDGFSRRTRGFPFLLPVCVLVLVSHFSTFPLRGSLTHHRPVQQSNVRVKVLDGKRQTTVLLATRAIH